ncbi:MAG: type I-C CRISPR-associated protein Cas8c/Csd1, partial [Deltaproteobacteria bacterium]|nr:type I-C CRISPR-associated protein Cas8c/Csd1 [Deltaproteobacteria bacterium]
ALEKTQTDAFGHQIGATIRDRFYSSASATPRSVFPRLLRTYQHHLSKMENYKINREKLVQEILDPLADFPAQLNLADQGLFAIGYYHQMRAFFTKKDNLESSLANQAPAAKREKEGQ